MIEFFLPIFFTSVIFMEYIYNMKKMNILILTVIFMLISSCSMVLPTVEVDFSISSEIPSDFDFLEIRVFDGTIEKRLELKDIGKGFSLELPKNVVLGILAFPVKDDKRLTPFGAVYPYSTHLDFKNGFTALLIERLYRGSLDTQAQTQDFISRFNWPKLVDLCSDFENPWDLDAQRIITAIASGRFKKSDVRLKETL